MSKGNAVMKVLGIAGSILGVVGIGLLKILRGGEPVKYSDEWFTTVSDDKFYAEREPVRKEARENGGDAHAEALLQRFDREEIRRLNDRYEREHPDAVPRHREHGWYLPNDD